MVVKGSCQQLLSLAIHAQKGCRASQGWGSSCHIRGCITGATKENRPSCQSMACPHVVTLSSCKEMKHGS